MSVANTAPGRRVRPGVVLPLLIALWMGGGGGVLAAPRGRAENARRFERIWTLTKDNFYDPKLRGLDWSAIGERYRPQVEAAASDAAFAEVVNRMLGELRTSHLGYFTDDDLEFYVLKSVFAGDLKGTPMDHIGVTGGREGNAFVVRAVLDGGPAALAGIQAGDRLWEADGAPLRAVGSFKGRAGEAVAIQMERPGESRRTLSVKPVRENGQQAFLEATRRSVRVVERAGRRLGYIHLWCMSHNAFREALESALSGKLANTDGLILDIRDGFGGTPFGYADLLFRPDVMWSERGRESRGRAFHTGYSRPMVLLVNGGTRSAKEYFAYQIKKSGRGLLVGSVTAGAFVAARAFPIGSDGLLELPIADLTLDGKRLEGTGVAPDVVAPSEGAYGPGDRQLARAVETLLSRLGASGRAVVGVGNRELSTGGPAHPVSDARASGQPDRRRSIVLLCLLGLSPVWFRRCQVRGRSATQHSA